MYFPTTCQISMQFCFLMFHMRSAPTCPIEIPLVNGPAAIPDSQITASSENAADLGAKQARLNSTAAWCPSGQDLDTSPNMYIQVSVKHCKLDIFTSLFENCL